MVVGEQPGAAVPTDVVVGTDDLLVIAGDDDRTAAEIHREVVTGLGDLGFGGDEDPPLGEDLVEVAVEPLPVDVERGGQALADDALVEERSGGRSSRSDSAPASAAPATCLRSWEMNASLGQ